MALRAYRDQKRREWVMPPLILPCYLFVEVGCGVAEPEQDDDVDEGRGGEEEEPGVFPVLNDHAGEEDVVEEEHAQQEQTQ